MWKTFEEFLRAFGVDPEKVQGKEREVMQKMYDAVKREVETSAAEGSKAGERFQAILNTARAACATGTDHVRAELLSFASELAAKREASVDEAQRKIVEKAAELAKAPDTSRTVPAEEQRTEHALPSDPNAILSRAEIVSAFGEVREDRNVYSLAARSILHHRNNGDMVSGAKLMEELNGRQGLLVIHEEKGTPRRRTITASSANVVLQMVYTLLLNKAYDDIKDSSDRLVTVVPGGPGEGTIPEVNPVAGMKRMNELDPYPFISSTERELKLGHYKFGVAFAQTRESMFFDAPARTERMLSSIARQGREMRRAFRIARATDSTGFDGKHVPHFGDDNGANAFYSADADGFGNFNLLTSNGLTDETNVTAVRKHLRKRKRSDGTYTRAALRTLLIPDALFEKAWKILTAVYAPSAIPTAAQTLILNPEGPQGPAENVRPEIIADPLVSDYTGDETTWFGGDPAQQFVEVEYWPFEVVPVLIAGDLQLRDIQQAWKAGFCSYIVSDGNMFFDKNTA